MNKGFKGLITLISSIGLLHSTFAADCVITETHFDANVNLCCPTMALDATGWYDPTLDVSSVCQGNMTTGLEHVKHLGLPAALSTSGSSVWDKDKFDDMFIQYYVGPDASGTQYGASAVTAQPKLLHPFFKANTSANGMFVNLGSLQNYPFLVYSISGFEPGSDVTLTFDVSSLMDESYFEYLTTVVCVGPAGKRLTDFINDYTYSGGAISSSKPLSVSVVSSDQSYTVDNSNYGVLRLTSATPTTKVVGFGATETVTHTATASPSGSVSFVFYRSTDCFKVPLGIDNLKVMGRVKPQIVYSGNPCPKQELRVFTKQSFPEGTKYTWKESVTGQSSTDKVFRFEPQAAQTKYTVTCSVKLPDCDEIFDADPIEITSGTCCENNGHPMAMKNIFFDDFGTFISDDTYEWTDRSGMIHTETIPSNQKHDAQSVGEDVPYVRAYNIEYSGATLDIPFLGDNLPKDSWRGTGIKTQLYDHGVYLISKRGGYNGGVIRDADNSENGGMLQFDLLDETANGVFCEECPMDKFFNIDIKHICVGSKINFSADLAAINNINGGIEVSLEYGNKSYFFDKVIFEKGNTDVEKWHRVKGELEIKPEDVDPNTEEIQIQMKLSHYPYYSDGVTIIPAGESSRDYAVDNILFQVCTPPDVDVDALLTGGTSLLELCSNETLELKADVSSSTLEYYDNITYLFQWSNQNPDVVADEDMEWHDLENELREKYLSEGSIKITDPSAHVAFSNIKDGTEENVYFRVVIGDRNYLTTTDIWKKQSAFNPCRAVSISTIPIKAGLKCAACSHLDFEDAGVTFTADKGKLTGKVLELCEGETAVIGIKEDVSGKDKNDDTYHGYDVSWSDGTTKTCSDADYEAPTITVSYDDVKAAGAAGKKYKISFHDNYDPSLSSTPCDIDDEITVIANPKPTNQLTNPVFCKGEGTEPTKEITGHEIQWYTAADTLTSAAEPTVAGLAASETFYYVVVDNATGCRSDVNEYDVTVNSADRNPVDNAGMIEYLKSEIKTNGGTIRDLNVQNPSGPFSTVSTLPAGYTLHIGLITGETTETMPDVKSATLGADEGPNYPKPTVVNVNSSNDEYLWYYTYFESAEGCKSDTLPVGVAIKGAPSPTPKPASFCVNSGNVETFNKYAEVSRDDPSGTLKFYEADGTTEITNADTKKPDVTTAGEHIYWVSQESSTGGGESEKKKLVITVYDVAPAQLTQASAKYCYDPTTEGEDITPVFFTDATSGQVMGAEDSKSTWEFFKGAAPGALSSGESTMKASTSEDGETSYYGRVKYKLSATETCYGDYIEYPVEVVKVPEPVVNSAITYQKEEGSGAGGFKKPTVQTSTAITTDPTKYNLVWYDGTTEITEAAATPVYSASMTELNKTYQLKHVQQVTSGLSCESDLVPVTVIVSVYPSPDVEMIELCENSPEFASLTTIPATAKPLVGTGGTVTNPASDFKLLWYESDGNGDLDPSTECSSIALSPAIQKSNGTPDPVVYTYWVRQRLISSVSAPYAESPAVAVTVTIYPTPRITIGSSATKCAGESQDLKELFDVKPVTCDVLYHNETTQTAETANSVVSEGGQYEVTAKFKVLSTGETCSSAPLPVNVYFHELDPVIIGDDATCPGQAVTLAGEARLKVNGRENTTEPVIYSWSNDQNSATGSAATYNTTAAGLANTGDEMTVKLEVSTSACHNIANKKPFTIKVGDGPRVGNIKFAEAGNSDTKNELISARNISFNSCGGKVSVDLTGVANEGGGSYTYSGAEAGSGTFSDMTAGSATLSLGAGSYTIDYVNKCPTSFSFEIIDYGLKATHDNGNMVLCEGDPWWAEVTVTKKHDTPTFEWKRDGIPVGSQARLDINPARPSDSGVYTYTLTSAGCHLDGEIAHSNPLKVKPYVVFDNTSYKAEYEVINGETLPISLGFTVPSTGSSSISSEIEWNEQIGGTRTTGDGFAEAIVKDYDFHIVACRNSADYCPAETDIKIKVDAKIGMTASVDYDEICVDDEIILSVDTSATTNKPLHPEALVLSVKETYGSTTNTYTFRESDRNPSTGALELKLKPQADAHYDVTYTYKPSTQTIQQDESDNSINVIVHPAFVLSHTSEEVCGEDGNQSHVTVSVFPAGTNLIWDDSDSEYVQGSGTNYGASFEPVHTASGIAPQTKIYKVTASNGICHDKDFTVDVTVHKPIDGSIDAVAKICQYEELSLNAASYQAESYEWYYIEKDTTFNGATAKLVPEPPYATFTLKMTRGVCSKQVDKEVEVTSAPVVYSVDSLGIRMVEVVMDPGAGTEPFRYIIDGREDDPEILNSVRDGLEYKEHVVKVVDDVNCSTEFRFVINSPAIEIPFVVSPDGNGVNDRFKVKGLSEGYPDAKVKIFDRWGKELASYRAGDGPDWDGTYNGNQMPSTDYWYEIQIKEIKKTYTGHFTLIRQ